MTREEPRWVPRLVIEAVHLDQIREHGGLIGIRDENALEAALARPRQRWTYEPESDLARLAAAYAFGICTAHLLRDGNKRISFLAAVIFLGLNGFDVVAPEDEVVGRMVALAAGELDEQGVADWLRGRIKPRSVD
ncbi:MAG: type II toxin-antitoxin system death-on-curing family toxin [Gemmatimonadetes bacterium]|nr:type II toxin-antitoxin system death-on-curing family toxin [Gemmatimonadota bacterium]MYD14865.1 type II toxin-antitoxin system death-on-curing family toxin [Gemmatimonadota bacterium]